MKPRYNVDNFFYKTRIASIVEVAKELKIRKNMKENEYGN